MRMCAQSSSGQHLKLGMLHSSLRFRLKLAAVTLAIVVSSIAAGAQRYEDFSTKRPLPRGSYLVIGVLGGIESWSSPRRPINVMAANLRERSLPNVYVETVEHLHSDLAIRLIIDALDQDRDGKL